MGALTNLRPRENTVAVDVGDAWWRGFLAAEARVVQIISYGRAVVIGVDIDVLGGFFF